MENQSLPSQSQEPTPTTPMQPFTTKSVPVVEQPLFDLAARNRMQAAGSTAGGWRGFYDANKIYVWAIVIGGVIIAVLSFFAFRKMPPAAPKEANVSINIDAPAQSPSGGDEIYKITIHNQDQQKLVKQQLELIYPEGEIYENSNPNAANLSGSLFPVPDLLPGQNAVVIVKAKISGSINDTKTLSARLHYSYSNFNSEFVKEQHFDVYLAASNILLQLTGPSSTNNAQLVEYNVAYQNNSDQSISNARVQLNFPDGFTFAIAEPSPDLGNNIWNVNTLAKGGQGTIKIHGTFNSANPGESKTITSEFLVLGNNGTYFKQADSSVVTAIGSLPLLVTQTFEQQGSSGVVNPGDTLRFSIKYQNNAQVPATAVNVVASLDAKSLDLSTIQAEGAQVNNNTITWNAASVPNLATLAPNESGSLSFSVQVKNPATKDSSKSLNIVSHVKIKSNEYETYFPGSDITLKILSPSSIGTNLAYLSGQLPPQVGKSTTYRVTLVLKNSTNDFSNTLVTAFIPVSGSFDASTLSDKSAQYDPATGKLAWNAGNLPAHTGQFTQAKTLTFSVTLNPSSSQIGTGPVLVKSITMDAQDTYTNQSIHNVTDNVTTQQLPGDNAYQQGQVTQ